MIRSLSKFHASVVRKSPCSSVAVAETAFRSGAGGALLTWSGRGKTEDRWLSTCADDDNVQKSPFEPIPTNKYINKTFSEFVSEKWTSSELKHKTAIIDGFTQDSRTFEQYHQHHGTIAANLQDHFCADHTSTIALFAPNHVDYVPICMAAATCGSKLTPINPQYKANELSKVLNQSQSSVLIAHWSCMEVALEALKDCPSVKHVITIPEDDGMAVTEGTVSLTSLKEHSNPLYDTNVKAKEDPSSHAVLLPYSSGTTGLPKGVCLSHTNLVANLLQLEALEAPVFHQDHHLFSPLPFFHIYGCVVSAIYSAWQGHKVITMSGPFDFALFLELLQKHQPHRAHLVPPIMVGLARHPLVDKFDFKSLSMIISAAAPLSIDIAKTVKNRLGCDVKEAWGMSEISPLGIITDDNNQRFGSVGQIAPSTFGKVVDVETRKSLGPHEEGELMIKGPQVMMGYMDDPDRTQACLDKSGWLKTGDMAKYDEDGFFYITDRIKELIKVKGFQVPPAELEALLFTHPEVSDAAVIAIDDERSGELPRAYVTLKDQESSQLSEAELKEWVEQRVAPHKRLEGGVEFIDVIPKSASGKILRRVLKEKYNEQLVHVA